MTVAFYDGHRWSNDGHRFSDGRGDGHRFQRRSPLQQWRWPSPEYRSFFFCFSCDGRRCTTAPTTATAPMVMAMATAIAGKSLALDTAIGMWQLLFAEKQWPLVDHWCQFLQARHNKAISRDTWSQLLEFARTVDPALSTYDAEGAWPYLIDEFVYFRK
ncbi:hypothetical protein ACOSP7_027768 [Xanthoceras sorbifolium]